MMVHLNKRRAQSTLEYAVLMVVIIGALIAIQTYLKRGVQGRLKSSADDIGDQFSPGNTNVVTSERSSTRQVQTVGLVTETNGAIKLDSTGNMTYAQGLSQTRILNDVSQSGSKTVILNDAAEKWQ